MSVVDTGDGGVTLAESEFALRWGLESKSCVAFAPLDVSRVSGVRTVADYLAINSRFITVVTCFCVSVLK